MSATPPPTLRLEHDVDRAVRAISSTGVELFEYVYRATEAQYESPRPYVHPVRTLGGRLVTVFRPWDHVWHKGITMALPNVGRDNFWGGATYSREAGGYADLGNNGSQEHDKVAGIALGHGDREGLASFAHELTWWREPAGGILNRVDADRIYTEERTLTAALLPGLDAWVLGWTSRLTNVSGAPVEMGSPTTEGRDNAGYGGLFWRGPRSFTGGELIGSDGTTGESVRGIRGPWAGLSGRHDGVDATSTVVFVDQTPEQGFDTKWFVRAEPFACLNPAPFFDRVRVVDDGETVQLRHAVVIADGASGFERMSRLADASHGATADAFAFAERQARDAGTAAERVGAL